ncbi:MAG TPA: MFS transporter [Candidatus Merdivicinus excrementipullorum]|uniref:MFS transporter n=1 Tax=Candidatus Merdivicinus excrementipullorum TaxID=2840867 RepID=A0A9D1FMF9_9FIRM|nr:MFS transporter [Candidatus Merdivicinus excrementipullorum]
MIRQNYNHTIYAAYIGYITQAIIVNFSPLLFLTFQRDYQISLGRISFLVSFNFVIQLLVDMIAARYVDRIGYRPCILAAHVSSVIGLVGLALFPSILPPYAGLLLATAFCAVGGGLIEVLISPIVEACPTEKKEAAMSILHSFYSWGQVFVVLLSTVFFTLFGAQNWKIMAVIWALVPFCNIFYFSQVPIATLPGAESGFSIKNLFKNRLFWVFSLLMACAGASEQSMAQWASAFAEAGLQVSKTVGDLAGPCAFAVAMGITRALYGKFSEKVPLSRFMTISGILCVISYLLASLSPNPVLALVGCSLCGFSVGIMWPGTLSLASKRIPLGGTAMFALLALAGDLGCATGPALVGNISDAFQSNLKIGILFAICSPILLLLGLFLLRAFRRKAAEK